LQVLVVWGGPLEAVFPPLALVIFLLFRAVSV
jgi:hypothetical protein